ncbi:MAG: hypothetical protein LBH32_15335 [Dysgonamonadaceae bacterium]|jgi:hypothetical protein|nr:hypothetical protein [Dysgonamonadaceae bacterium]
MKKIKFLIIAILLTTGAFAERQSFRERADNWRQRENSEDKSGIQRSAINDGETPNDELSVPAGDLTLLEIILVSGLYIYIYIYIYRERERERKVSPKI